MTALLSPVSHKGLCHGILVLGSSCAVAELPDDAGRQRFLRVDNLSREEASAVLDATFATLPKEVASGAALASVKERILPPTTLPKLIGDLAKQLRASTSEADLRARTEAWAQWFEAKARDAVAGALTFDLTSGEPSRFRVANLMREILAAGKPVKPPSALCKIEAATFAARSTSPAARIALRRRRWR
jgi:hypothetical protein